jgi:hypothetical protein
MQEGSPSLSLADAIDRYTAIFGAGWKPVTRKKHQSDFERLIDWLTLERLPLTTASLEFHILVRYVEHLRARPKVGGVWRGAPDARARSAAAGPAGTLSANSVNAYVRPIRSLCIWLVDEGFLPVNPFRRSRRRAALNPLLPSEETPTKGATLDDLHALHRAAPATRHSTCGIGPSCRSWSPPPRATAACVCCGSRTSTSNET